MPGISPSVLIIRLDAIGDALALTPLLAALRERRIPADIVLRPVNAGIFSSRAARRIVTGDFDLRSSDPPNLARIAAFGRELSANHYTHVLVATEDPGGYRLARATEAKARIGFTNGWGKPFKTLWARAHLTKTIHRSAGLDPRAPHEVEVLFRLGAPLLGDATPTRDVETLRKLILEREPAADTRIAVQITDKWQRLKIDFSGVVDLVHHLTRNGTPRLLSASSEDSYANIVAEVTGIEVERFDTLESWKAAIAAAPALITPDSGALHVAGMVGTPTVAIFPPSDDFTLQTARWAPWASPHRIVRADGDWPRIAGEAARTLADSRSRR